MFFLTFYSSKNPEIMYPCFHKKILSSTIVLNTDSKKKNYWAAKQWFLKDRVTENRINDSWKFSYAITWIKYILKYIQSEKKNVIIKI